MSSAISVPQCILAVYVQYTLNTLEFDLGKQQDNALGSIRLSIRLSLLSCSSRLILIGLGFAEYSKEQQELCLFVCNQWALADNRTDAVDRLLILRKD